jgi:TonB-linked SusC/RagA family outer membrane protein
MTRIFSLFVVFMLTGVLAFSQSRVVTGTVTDGKGNPVPFASISVVGSKAGDVADANGTFSFKTTAEKGQIRVTSGGYEGATQDFIAGARVNVELKKTNANLETVVVTGALGIQRQAKSLGYATAKVGSTVLNQSAPVNVANGLQGKVSGLNISSSNNGVFEDVKINLRGIRSLTGDNNPMLLLDGVITPISFLNTINPKDIADVNIIKGPSGAGIYGPAARNGVFIVTTKRGTRGDKPVINVSRTTQFSKVSFFPKMQTEFGTGFGGGFVEYENWSWGPRYDGSMRVVGSKLKDGSQQMLPYSPTNSRQEFFNTGVTNQTDVSISAKEFYLSLQDAKITGIVPDDENRRINVRLNSDKTFGKFKVAIGMNYIQQNSNTFDDDGMSSFQRNIAGAGLNDGLLNLIFNTAAHIPLKNYKDLNSKYARYDNYYNHYGLNPYFALDNWRRIGKIDNLITNADVNFKATENLSLTWRVSGNFRNNNQSATSKGFDVEGSAPNTNQDVPGGYSETSNRTSTINSELFATYKKTVGNFRFDVIGGNFWRETQGKAFNANISNLVVPGLFNLGNLTGNPGASSQISKTRLYSLYAQTTLSYKGWINLDLTGRNDWTSVYAFKNRSVFYPGANLSIVLSDAIPNFANNKAISFLKLRASANRTANADINPYLLESTFSGTSGGFPYAIPGYTANNTSANPDLKPEIIKSYEAGLEIGFLKNRINLEVAAYTQDNSDQVINVGVSPTTGYTTLSTNAAAFRNRGLDLDLRLTPLVNLGEVKFDLNLNASYNNSKITKIFTGLDRLQIGGVSNNATQFFSQTVSNYAIVGQPAFVLLATDNVRDAQGRVIVDRNTGLPTQAAELKQFGRSTPLWTAGISPTISYKNIRFTVVGEFKTGHQSYSRIGNEMAWTGVSAVTAQNGRERFVYPNSVYDDGTGKLVPNTNVQVNDVESYYTGVFRNVASNFIHSASSWRIREVSLSYRLPASLLANQKLLKDFTFTVNARNLFLWVPESNQYTDPDFGFTSSSSTERDRNAQGITTSSINPPTRTFGITLAATF